MARSLNRLSARKAASLTAPGRYADGGNLYLQISSNGGRRWTFKYTFRGRGHELGLGSFKSVSLSRAREKAKEYRELLAEGRDPKDFRARAALVPTFGQFADEFVSQMSAQFRNAKHVAQWRMTLTEYTAPMRDLPVDSIGTDHILATLQPIWTTKAETASRLRGRIERVLDSAKAKGLRDGENPARWRGHLETLLPKRQKLTRGHHQAMPYKQLPAFVDKLRRTESSSGRALEFLILTASRTSEVIEARWTEVDFEQAIWSVPPHRMKAGQLHRVPLSLRAIELLGEMKSLKSGEFIFPGQRPNRPLSNMALSKVLDRLQAKCTVHGFRSSFRDWAAEEAEAPREVAELCLAHNIASAVERAYQRGDLLYSRRKLLDSWQLYLFHGR
ncbi:integrase [Amorphus suaedae]